MLLVVLLPAISPADAQVPREDVIWARATSEAITLDGVLNEASWAAAESVTIEWATDAGLPGSGWKVESGNLFAVDPLHATLKFLVVDNQL
jgi:hypothetical protein